MLRDDINAALKQAMKAHDERRVSTLRLVNSALKNADIEARGHGKGPLTDEELLGLLQKMIKQRQESVELYEKGGRPELAQNEREEITIISAYLPQQMSEAEAEAAIAAVIKDVGAASMKDMGKVMTALKERHAGELDFSKASGTVKGLLSR
ncbi:MAG: GatB/YqeY domain-containing protein [Rhodoplanes sp.]